MFRVGGLAWPCPPFGWNLSLVLAQETLGALILDHLDRCGFKACLWRSLFVFHYYYDILVLSLGSERCASYKSHLVSYLQLNGLFFQINQKPILGHF